MAEGAAEGRVDVSRGPWSRGATSHARTSSDAATEPTAQRTPGSGRPRRDPAGEAISAGRAASSAAKTSFPLRIVEVTEERPNERID